MNRGAIASYKKKLLDLREELTADIIRTEHDGRAAEDTDPHDLVDQAANTYNKETLFQQSSHEREILKLVEDALRRAEDGTFGACVHCGRPAEAKRLEAMPWAGLCVACQQLRENGLL